MGSELKKSKHKNNKTLSYILAAKEFAAFEHFPAAQKVFLFFFCMLMIKINATSQCRTRSRHCVSSWCLQENKAGAPLFPYTQYKRFFLPVEVNVAQPTSAQVPPQPSFFMPLQPRLGQDFTATVHKCQAFSRVEQLSQCRYKSEQVKWAQTEATNHICSVNWRTILIRFLCWDPNKNINVNLFFFFLHRLRGIL